MRVRVRILETSDNTAIRTSRNKSTNKAACQRRGRVTIHARVKVGNLLSLPGAKNARGYLRGWGRGPKRKGVLATASRTTGGMVTYKGLSAFSRTA